MSASPRRVLVAPSILTADFGRLAEEARAAEAGGADLWHLDVMDGHFVPAITFGTRVVELFRRETALPIEVHLMVATPADHLRPFAEAGAARLIWHYEATGETEALVASTHALGCQAGVAINPETPAEAVRQHLELLDEVNVMLIAPGRGGQVMMPEHLEKVRLLRRWVDDAGLDTLIEVDGGVKAENVDRCVEAGVDLVVAGSAVFNERQAPGAALEELRAALEGRPAS